jgi:hypothetical protein
VALEHRSALAPPQRRRTPEKTRTVTPAPAKAPIEYSQPRHNTGWELPVQGISFSQKDTRPDLANPYPPHHFAFDPPDPSVVVPLHLVSAFRNKQSSCVELAPAAKHRLPYRSNRRDRRHCRRGHTSSGRPLDYRALGGSHTAGVSLAPSLRY